MMTYNDGVIVGTIIGIIITICAMWLVENKKRGEIK